jgi:Rieske Fe-S protein
VIGARIRKGSIPIGLYWDTGDQNSKNSRVPPYHYVRIQRMENDDKNYDLLIVGGEDHKTGNQESGGGEEAGGRAGMEERFKRLEQWTKERFPVEKENIDYRWSGQIMEPMDSLAFIGHNPGDEVNNNNIYIATGDSGNGMTHGTIAGMLLTDLILGKNNKWSTLYDPSRKINKDNPKNSYSSKADNNNKNSSSLNKNNNDKEKISTPSIERLGLEQGMIIEGGKGEQREGEKDINNNDPIALYKDGNGTIHAFSAICTHLGCTITWNSLEKSFDCPCHGSRFSSRGKVINGPANNNLEQKDHYSVG